MLAVVVVLAAFLGLGVGAAANRAAGAFPWGGAGERSGRAVRLPVLELLTAVFFALTALRFGPAWELPAFLAVVGAGVLLTVIDLRHRLLPNRVVVPALLVTAALLGLAAAADDAWDLLVRSLLAAAVLFAVYLGMALLSPGAMGMGDVKLAALLGLVLGWIGWGAVLLGAFAGFVVQAVLALVLIAARRISLRGELPFGPAMLVGAALVVGWSEALLG
ncbi:prepilin peptidase [Blastococcus sp. TBT05-19]|uniref:prepilin peptidase n=1 Tax=Blastococcus sp. TBT05-19 TaxID=2250581 RepID=UPI000DE84F59|nr:A24 family peptidase [Blastococcus sp. TBT05-19]RBY94866.1 prepilin peptidase [Blastococcus sp. TBT05-19]